MTWYAKSMGFIKAQKLAGQYARAAVAAIAKVTTGEVQ